MFLTFTKRVFIRPVDLSLLTGRGNACPYLFLEPVEVLELSSEVPIDFVQLTVVVME